MRGSTVRLDVDAFNHGVTEVLELRPIRRALGKMVTTSKRSPAKKNALVTKKHYHDKNK